MSLTTVPPHPAQRPAGSAVRHDQLASRRAAFSRTWSSVPDLSRGLAALIGGILGISFGGGIGPVWLVTTGMSVVALGALTSLIDPRWPRPVTRWRGVSLGPLAMLSMFRSRPCATAKQRRGRR